MFSHRKLKELGNPNLQMQIRPISININLHVIMQIEKTLFPTSNFVIFSFLAVEDHLIRNKIFRVCDLH